MSDEPSASENSIEGKSDSQRLIGKEYVLLSDWVQLYLSDSDQWIKLWSVLTHQCIMLYTSDSEEDDQWFGTVMLKSFEITEKLACVLTLTYGPNDASWSSKNEHITETLQTASSLDFMTLSEVSKTCWIDSLSALLPILPSEEKVEDTSIKTEEKEEQEEGSLQEQQGQEETVELQEEGSLQEQQGQEETVELELKSEIPETEETIYIEREEETPQKLDVDIGGALWSVFSQVGPGMNIETLSLPYAILEPRSFLDKFADFLLHIDILSQAAAENDPLKRMKLVTKWYLSGFYTQPKDLKKPYTPIQGELFRCYLYHPKTRSKTFYIAEQVKKTPPETAFYIINQKDGFCISGSTIASVSFSGNSITAGVEQKANVFLFPFNESYSLGMPSAQCSGILLGNVTLELVGEVSINCAETLYSTTIDFKTKPYFGGSDGLNQIEGEIKYSNNTVATIKGHWDSIVYLSDENEQDQLLWDPESILTDKKLKQFVVPISMQEPNESERLWLPVTTAIQNCDQEAVNQEIEKINHKDSDYTEPRLFVFNEAENIWTYKYKQSHAWDPEIHNYQFESNFIVQSGTQEEFKFPITKEAKEEYKLPTVIPSGAAIGVSSSSKEALPIANQVHKLLNSLDDLHEKYGLLLRGLQVYADSLKIHGGTSVEEDTSKRTLCMFIVVCLIKIGISAIQNW